MVEYGRQKANWMIGRPAKQLNFLDSVFSNRKKRARTDALLQKVNQLIDWSFLVEMVEKTYKPSHLADPVFLCCI